MADGAGSGDGLQEGPQAGFVTKPAEIPGPLPGARNGPPARADLTEAERRTLVALGRRVLYHNVGTRRLIQEAGINVVPANFYSEIPTLAELDRAFEYGEPEPFMAPYIDAGAMLGEYAGLLPFSRDFDPPLDQPVEGHGFYWRNNAFSFCDAMVYYAMIRRHRPARVVEIGSGHSTRAAAQALADNGTGELTCFEPFPMDWLPRVVTDLREERAQDITAEALNDLLGDGDVLFIDSTHTVKFGSDCLHIYLRLLPFINRRIFVHAHDIYLPDAFPMRQGADRQIYWTEQYLLHAFMLHNPRCRFLLGNAYGTKVAADAQRAVMRGRYANGGGSWWFEWLGTGATA